MDVRFVVVECCAAYSTELCVLALPAVARVAGAEWVSKGIAATAQGVSAGFWLGIRGRRLTVREVTRAMGFRYCDYVWPADKYVYGLVGNAISVATLHRILVVKRIRPFYKDRPNL